MSKVLHQLPEVEYFKGVDLNLLSASAKVFPDVQKKIILMLRLETVSRRREKKIIIRWKIAECKLQNCLKCSNLQ